MTKYVFTVLHVSDYIYRMYLAFCAECEARKHMPLVRFAHFRPS